MKTTAPPDRPAGTTARGLSATPAGAVALTAGQHAQLRAALHERERTLGRRLLEQREGLSQAEHAHDRLQRDGDEAPLHEGEREVDHALTDLEQHELAAVQAALQRLADGRYGVCADCSEDIPFDRLRAEPWALCCVECTARRERAAAGRGG